MADSDANECTIYSMYVKILIELHIFASKMKENTFAVNTRSERDEHMLKNMILSAKLYSKKIRLEICTNKSVKYAPKI